MVNHSILSGVSRRTATRIARNERAKTHRIRIKKSGKGKYDVVIESKSVPGKYTGRLFFKKAHRKHTQKGRRQKRR